MTAPDLTALADKLDELAMKATPGPWLPPEVIPPMGREAGWVLLRFNGEGYAWTDMPKQLTFNSEPRSRDEYLQDVADAELLIALRNALPQITTALREAARLREVEKITLMLASFKDPRTVSCPDEELELFAKIIEDAKAIHGDLHEDEEPGHGA